MRNILFLMIIIIASATAFYPSLENGFVNTWDDNEYLIQNQSIRSLDIRNIKNIFTSLHRSQYKPLTILTFAVEYTFAGLKPFLYHFDNLLLHLLNSVLVYLIFLSVSKKSEIAFLTSLLFGIHPMHVESVAWVTERKDVLYGFFYLLSLLMYLHYRKSGKVFLYILSIFSFFLSLISKQQALLFVFILLLFDYYHFKKFDKQILLEKIPYFLLLIILLPVLLLSLEQGTVSFAENHIGFTGLFLNACYAIVFYMYKLIFPVRLAGLYPVTSEFDTLANIAYIASPAILALTGFIVWRSVKRTGKIDEVVKSSDRLLVKKSVW